MSSANSSSRPDFRSSDSDLDHQVEQFPLVVLAYTEDDLQGVLLGSLERIGGTPSILWGAGVARKGKDAAATLRTMTSELSRRAAISFPDEDVVVAARIHRPSAYTLLQTLRERGAPARATRRTARTARGAGGSPSASASSGHFDDRSFRVAVKGRKPPCVPVLDASPIKATGGAKIVSLVGELDANKGQAMIAFGWAVAEDLAAGSYVAAR